jgi:hypothetical protein
LHFFEKLLENKHMNETNHDTNMTGNADNRSDLRTNCGHEINQDVQDPYEREAAKAAIKVLKRELAEVRKQRDALADALEYLVFTCEAIDCAAIMPAAMPDAYSKAIQTLAAVKGGEA